MDITGYQAATDEMVLGERGAAGPSGSRGMKGEMGPSGTDTDHRNWKQCAWKNNDGRDIGLIKAGCF